MYVIQIQGIEDEIGTQAATPTMVQCDGLARIVP